ncbi:hypothetical protein [Pseudomonas savastanoi]|uniref:hypothetical protein n=1 Tax=Pseudomonas savastanoi TaxID=29438 RepID=UPI0012B96AB8|nr:hypothetical protein [Pseudomonas savastanoi]
MMRKHSHVCDVTTADKVIRSVVEMKWDEAKQHFVLVVLDANTKEVLYDCVKEEPRHKTLEQYLWFLRCHKVILPGEMIMAVAAGAFGEGEGEGIDETRVWP